MKHQKPLSDFYRLYIKGDLPRKELEGRIFKYLLRNNDRYRLFDGNQDRWNEYLSWLYPRLVRAVDLYQEQGASFDTYISCLVYSTSKEYRCREADRRITEYICWKVKAEEAEVCEAENEYCESGKEIDIPKGIRPKQILLLILKSYYFVSDELVKKAAAAIGMESREIQNMVDELRKRRSEKEDEILDLRERLYCQHYRCMAYQKRMNIAQPGTEYFEKMKVRYERARKRFLTMKKRLGGMRVDASNRMIAQVTGIPKGTVDSNFFAMKNHLDSSATGFPCGL